MDQFWEELTSVNAEFLHRDLPKALQHDVLGII